MLNLYIAPEKCYHCTLWSADLMHLIEVVLLVIEKRTCLKHPVVLVYFMTNYISDKQELHELLKSVQALDACIPHASWLPSVRILDNFQSWKNKPNF